MLTEPEREIARDQVDQMLVSQSALLAQSIAEARTNRQVVTKTMVSLLMLSQQLGFETGPITLDEPHSFVFAEVAFGAVAAGAPEDDTTNDWWLTMSVDLERGLRRIGGLDDA